MLQILEILTLVISGWLAGAESGSWSCVHPVIEKLKPEDQIVFQKGLLKTFGRIMPVLMPLNFILAITLCSYSTEENPTVFFLRIAAVIFLATMIITTVVFNVPVNIQTGKWTEDYNDKWEKKRKTWRFFQGYRSIILIIAFIILVVAQIIS
jgi:uncharacterized membrane protein